MANVRRGNKSLWPYGLVPYEIDSGSFPVGSGARAKVDWAIDHWNSRCRVKFVRRTRGSRANWARFISHPSSCSSAVGRIPFSNSFGSPLPQEIRCQLGSDGFRRGSIVHEMGHAIGLYHEHQRPDRDDFVTVSGTGVNFDRKSPSEVIEFTPYDYQSIMHYPGSAEVVVPAGVTVGQRDRLSYLDIYAIERRYEVGGGDLWAEPVLHILH